MNKIIKYNGKLNVIGSKIKDLRLQHEWSLAQLSDQLMFLGFDIPKSSIDNIEKGKRIVKEYEFYAFCKVFDISMEEMLNDFITI
jgi:transcriptional regulator with XRE-family HTH domain